MLNMKKKGGAFILNNTWEMKFSFYGIFWESINLIGLYHVGR